MRLLLSLLFLALFFTGCDSADDDGGGDIALGSMTAEIDGQDWNAANATITDVNVAGNRTLTINGARVGAEISTLNVSVTAVGGATLGTGAYAIGDDGTDNVFGTGAYAPSPGPQATYLATSGTLTIDAIDDDGARGTFAFTAERPNTGETVTVASGRFNVEFGPSLPTFP
jgi:hypothetical protein